jgi:glucose/arabinose dehydrogenase
MLYLTVGSTCNCCIEKNPENATILRVQPDGSRRKIFARGLRNTIGFGWHPKTQEMWGMDHGSDWLGPDTPPEELNKLEEGRDYGWPFVYGDRQVIPGWESHPKFGNLKRYAARTTPPVLGYQAHSSPIQMVFYTASQFPEEYRNDAFVAMRGSWNRKPPIGYEVVRIKFDKEGRPVAFQKFLTGFLIEGGRAFFGRLAGLAVAKDGSLLVGDDTNGVIYRVSYQGKVR